MKTAVAKWDLKSEKIERSENEKRQMNGLLGEAPVAKPPVAKPPALRSKENQGAKPREWPKSSETGGIMEDLREGQGLALTTQIFCSKMMRTTVKVKHFELILGQLLF